MKFFQSKHNKNPIEEEKNLLVYILCALLKESNNKLAIKHVTEDTLLEYGIEIDVSMLAPNDPLEIKLIEEKDETKR